MARASRYDGVPRFEPGPHGSVLFGGLLPRPVPTPDGVLEHVVKEGDRSDALAHSYYRDSRLWYRILDANPQLVWGGEIADDDMVGLVIVIPGSPS